MDPRELTFINEGFFADRVEPFEMDILLETGWRHFGKYFFRYSLALHNDQIEAVVPLRIRLENFSMSKSLRRIRRLNSDLNEEFGRIVLDDDIQSLFDIHKERFKGHKPESITHFLDPDADRVPGDGREFRLYTPEKELVAVSYFDEAECSVSGVYAMFDPQYSRRSPGIYTILLEIEHAINTGKNFYYLGYAYEGASFYDYKKRFTGLEQYDWKRDWTEYGTSGPEPSGAIPDGSS